MPRKKGKGRGQAQAQAAEEPPRPGAQAPGPQQQPPRGPPQQQQEQQPPRGPPQQQQQQQPQRGPPLQQQPPRGPPPQTQQPPRGPPPQTQQPPRGPPPQTQQQPPRGPWQQQQPSRGPPPQQQQQQQPPRGPPPQQQAPPQQQQQPQRGPPQQQQQQPQQGGARPKSSAPPHVISGGVSAVSQQLSRLTVDGSHDFPKQQIGTLGRRIMLFANHFKVDLPRGSVFHYDVDIRAVKKDKKSGPIKPSPVPRVGVKPEGLPPKLNAKLCRQIMEELFVRYKIKTTHYPAYDGNKNLYTRKRLPIDQPTQFDVLLIKTPGDSGSEELFQVTIKPAEKSESGDCEVSLEPLHQMEEGRAITYPEETVLALDIIMRYGPSLKSVPVGRSFYLKPNSAQEVVMEEGRAIWFGYYQSLRPGWKPLPKGFATNFYLNIDKSATAFLRPLNLIDFAMEVLNLRDVPPNLNAYQVLKLSKDLRHVQIKVLHLPYPRKYRILKIVPQTANQKKFNLNNQQVTIENYFQTQYKRKLRYPNFPCVQVGDPKREIFLPMEVCQILEEQPSRGKLTPGQAAEMITHTAIPPKQRFDEIQRYLRKSKEDSKDFLKEFEINISDEPVQLPGRVLPPPALEYQGSKAPVRDGQWEMRGKYFIQGCTIKKWVILSLSRAQARDMVNFAKKLIQSGLDAGMHFEELCAQPGEFPRVQLGGVGNILGQYKQQFPDLELAVVVLGKLSPLYKEVKHEGETNIGLITQCITDENIRKCQNDRFSFRFLMNICQKINAKLGGTNVSLQRTDKPLIFAQPIIVIGADVTHPAPGINDGYSIAACVGSVDSYPAKYVTKILIQKVRNESRAREERILDLDVMIKDLLKEFFKNTRKKPERIVYFRDGVSEGQFLQVRNHELKKIRDACTALTPGYEPKISFIVVQKRHHTRFSPQNFRDGLERYNNNVPAGTTVDTEITHPSYFNFFLASHVALQGTTKPAHYTVLWDDNDFSADILQKFVFYLCHTYNRCTRSISIPPPVAYADLAAFRAKLYIDNKNEKMSASTNSSDSLSEDMLREYMEAIVTKDNVKSNMYFV